MKFGKNIFLFLFGMIFAINSIGQTWYITRGLSTDEVAWAVDVDSVGNIYWAVEEKDQWPYWYYNILLFKIDSNAQQVWQSNSFGSTYNEIAFKATVNGSDVYLSGRTDSTLSPVSGDALVTSSAILNGSFNWAYSYNPVPDYGYEEIDGLNVQPDGIYLSGWKQQQNTNDMDFLVQKINFSGQLIWTNIWDYNSLGKFDGANGHMTMDNNFLYVAGHVNKTNIVSLDGDAALVCFNRSNGAYQWHVTWGGALYDDALGMTMSSDSILYITGYTGSFGNGSQNYLNKYSRSGVLQWSRIWGGTGTEDSRSLVTDGDSIIYVVGATSSYGNGLKDIFILKYDTAGTLIDSLFWGGAYDETAKDVARFGDYLYITGETKSYGNGQIIGDHNSDGLLLKINGRTMQAPDSTMNSVTSQIKYPNEIQFITDYHRNIAVFQFDDMGNEHFSIRAFNTIGQEIAIQPEIIRDGNNVTININMNSLSEGVVFLQLHKNDIYKTAKLITIK